ncbi:hypothetical protein FRACA_1180009 [Frankia canadensis]|uniref:Cryptochrome/DNA photolyase FAD-binding domain-containing protein n=1 Tax=Frankia canadensis TaxID=1836972 RepID=A0A2I2KJQ9_9ACTN|nr:hypothetical protein FRACA_1180009 [Frankia canadensis]SOU53201.1 hypothetical protein FRACA_1180009 [Frankia canadensis]
MAGEDYLDRNALHATAPLPGWFTDLDADSLEAACLSDVLAGVRDRAWVHHIPRLMVLGNWALQRGYDPRALADFFHESFADGYAWVMAANVVGMSQHADGGLMATKPYASGGACAAPSPAWTASPTARPSSRPSATAATPRPEVFRRRKAEYSDCTGSLARPGGSLARSTSEGRRHECRGNRKVRFNSAYQGRCRSRWIRPKSRLAHRRKDRADCSSTTRAQVRLCPLHTQLRGPRLRGPRPGGTTGVPSARPAGGCGLRCLGRRRARHRRRRGRADDGAPHAGSSPEPGRRDPRTMPAGHRVSRGSAAAPCWTSLRPYVGRSTRHLSGNLLLCVSVHRSCSQTSTALRERVQERCDAASENYLEPHDGPYLHQPRQCRRRTCPRCTHSPRRRSP